MSPEVVPRKSSGGGDTTTIVDHLRYDAFGKIISHGGATGRKGFRFFGISEPPSQEMKKVLTQYFGAEQ